MGSDCCASSCVASLAPLPDHRRDDGDIKPGSLPPPGLVRDVRVASVIEGFGVLLDEGWQTSGLGNGVLGDEVSKSVVSLDYFTAHLAMKTVVAKPVVFAPAASGWRVCGGTGGMLASHHGIEDGQVVAQADGSDKGLV